MGEERYVFRKDKNGYLVTCTLMTKVIPTLEKEITIDGFICELDTTKSLETDQIINYL